MEDADAQRWRPDTMTPRWRSRQKLEEHFGDHRDEFGDIDIDAYEASALDTIDVGTPFTYEDRGTRTPRLGYFDPETGRFTGTSPDGRLILTHFIPDDGEDYVLDRPNSTYA
jgi:pyocin large subunit-like protein